MNMAMRYVLACVAMLLTASLWAGDRGTADILLVSVPKLIEGNDCKTAEDMCKRALASDDSSPAAHFFLGMIMEKTNKPHEAFAEYQTAQTLADKEKDAAMVRKAGDAAKKIGAGLIEISQADQRLVAKLLIVAGEALDAEQLETARSAYASAVAVAPNNDKAKEGLDKANKAIEARGDPVKAKIAQAALAEVWYKIGIGEKKEALEKAKDLAQRCADTEAGKEAADLVARNFEAPKTEEMKKLKEQLAEQKLKEKKASAAIAAASVAAPAAPTAPATPTTPVAPAPTGPKVATPASAGPAVSVDVDALEKLAEADTAKLAKDAVIPAYKETYHKGKGFYSKATPGTEGNQANVVAALEQYIRCEQLYMRADNEKLLNDEINALQKDASMMRYACMKMIILSH